MKSVQTTESHVSATLDRSRKLALACVAVFALMAVAIHIFPLTVFVQGMLWDGLSPIITNRDFSNYWMAGQLVLSGEQQDLFSQPVYFAHLQEAFGPAYGIHNWGYPPHFLLVLWPLGMLGYKVGMLFFLAATLALFVFAVLVFRRRFSPQSDRLILFLALLGYVLMMVDTAQNGFLTAAALLLGLAWMKDRPVLAGFAFAFLTIKPQLGILIPLLLIFDRNWRVMIWATIFTILLVGLSIVFFGLNSWYAYLTETLLYQRSVMTDWYGIFLRMMPTVFGSMRTLGLSPQLAALAQWPVSLCTAALVVWLLWKEADPLRRALVVVCGTFVISPYAFNYDMGALTAVAAILVGSRQPMDRHAVFSIAVVAALSGVVTNLGRANVPIAPLFLAAGLVAIAVETWRSQNSRPGERQLALSDIP